MVQIKNFTRWRGMERPIDKYKLSMYNVIHEEGDMQHMWNTYTGALLKLDKSGQEYVRSFSGVDDGSNEFKLMKDNGFIVYDELDEFFRVCLEEKQAMFDPTPERLHLIIAPGMGCNYKCGHCFEKNSDLTGVMTPEIADDVAKYVCEQLHKNPNVKLLQVTWFGGEPLLYVDIIERISRKIIEYTQKHNIQYAAWMATNGRHLDKDTLLKLQELSLEKAQITVNGMSDVYCKSKGASPEDFNIVIDNICFAVEQGLNVTVNILNNDANEAIKTTDYLLKQRNLQGRVRVSFHQVLDYSQPPDISQQAYLEYDHNFFQWLNYMIKEYGIYEEIGYIFRKRKSTTCDLIKVSNVCIGPRGELYKCFRHSGVKSMVIGDIWGKRFFNDAENMFYSTCDDPKKKECAICEYLPFCMGDCQCWRVTGFERCDCESRKNTFLKLKLLEGGVSI
jgi:uncharacterized protein